MSLRKTMALMFALLFLVGAVLPPSAMAATKRRIAILPFEYGAVSSTVGTYDVGKGIVGLLVTKLVNDGTYSVVDRQMLDSILKEQNLSVSDRADPEWTPYVGDYDFDRSEMPAVREAIRAELLAQLNGLYGEPVGMSSAFRWDTTTEERFFFADSEYDVRRAKELIVARPRVVEQLDVSSIAGFASRVLGMNPSQDAVDLRFPVLVALTRRGTPIPIDGWNRIRKSIATGSVTVPAVFLNARESKLVRVQ